MTKRKYSIPALVANIVTFLIILATLFSINSEIAEIKNAPPSEGVDLSGLSVGILGIIAVFAMIYGGVVFLNVFLKTLQVIFDKWGFSVPCIIIDLLMLAVSLALCINAVNEGGVDGIAVGGGLVVLTLVSVCSNVLSIAKRNEDA